jgi:DNA-binding winged helix-turn-helix (wHTH) protein
MEDLSYGFLIDNDIHFIIAYKKLMYYSDESDVSSMLFRVVSLNETQARLLLFLLENRKSEVIDKNHIMKSVWDEFGMSSSNQRLWQAINELRKKFSAIGLSGDLITNVHGIGYSVDNRRVMSLFIK